MARGHSRSWAMPPFDRAHNYSTLIETMCLSFAVFKTQPVICQKSQILTHPTCIWRPRGGGAPVKFRGDLWQQKPRVAGLSCGVVLVILCLAVLVELRLVTDRQTDGRTQGHSVYHACIASHDNLLVRGK